MNNQTKTQKPRFARTAVFLYPRMGGILKMQEQFSGYARMGGILEMQEQFLGYVRGINELKIVPYLSSISTIHGGRIPWAHDCMEAGGRGAPGAVTEYAQERRLPECPLAVTTTRQEQFLGYVRGMGGILEMQQQYLD